jgi:hypothetical protein
MAASEGGRASIAGMGAASALSTGRMCWVPVANRRIAHCRISSQRPLFERAGHLSTEYRVPRPHHWQVELRANG